MDFYMNMAEENKIADFEKRLVENLNRYLSYNRISQDKLALLCKENGYNISQSTLSRLCSSQRRITVYYLHAICKALRIKIDDLISCGRTDTIRQEFLESNRSAGKIVSDPYLEEKEFEAYLGDYYIFYLSTNNSDIYEKGKIIKGRLSIEKKKSLPYCYVGVKINSGVNECKDEHTFKYYQGQMVIMKQKNVACIIVRGESDGEISVIMLRHRTDQNPNIVECRVGAVLTVSTGDEKAPCIQRVILSRKLLSEEELGFLMPVFKLRRDRVLILKGDYEEIVHTLQIPNAQIDKINKYLDVQEYLEVSNNILNEIHEKVFKGGREDIFYRFQEKLSDKDILGMANDCVDATQDKNLCAILNFLKRQGEAM